LRSAVLALALAMFVPLAIPATASARLIPGIALPGEYINQVNAVSQTNLKTDFRVKFQLDQGYAYGSVLDADNRATALTSKCADCNAIAIGFQVVYTTQQDLAAIHALNVASATNFECVDVCNAVADAYQVVVAIDSPDTYGWTVTFPQMLALSQVRDEFYALPTSGLDIAQIQSQCEELVNEVVSILAGSSSQAQDGTGPTLIPGVSGSALPSELTGEGRPIVDLFRDVQWRPSSTH
jgi:hypothetical protein